jgi:hypothetical protein
MGLQQISDVQRFQNTSPSGSIPVKDEREKFARNFEACSHRQGDAKVDGSTAEVTVAGRLPHPGNQRGAGKACQPGN